MMFKRLLKIAITLVALIIIIPGIKAVSMPLNKGILIVYDAHNIYGNKENVVNMVNRIATESNKPVEMKKMNLSNKNEFENLDEYSNIIVLNCNTEKFNKSFLQEINKQKNKVIYISNIEDTGLEYKTKIPIIQTENDYFNFRNEILSKLTNEEFSQDRYLMINNVTPFMDLNDLVAKIKYLNTHGIPFIINAIPVFENPTFKAMQNFTEVLRYAQASGGYIVLSCPYINQGGATVNQIFNAMTEGYTNYINYLVYPIGISMPNYLLYRDGFKKDLEKSNTVFVQNTSVDMSWLNDYSNPVFENVIQEVPYKESINNNLNNMVGSIAITLDNDQDINTFETKVQNLINSGINFNSPTNLNAKIDINGNKIECKINGVYLNNKYVQQNSYISNKELFKESDTNQIPENKNIDISDISDRLMIFAGIACVIFIAITILSKRLDKKKYFRDRRK